MPRKRVEQVVVLDPLSDPRIEKLEWRFAELRAQMLRDMVETAVELGEILAEARPLLRGQYGRWLARLGISPQTALNYERLAEFTREQPDLFLAWKELGAAKLYRVSRLGKAARRRVLRKRHAPALLEMNAREFSALTSEHVVTRRRVTPAMKAHGFLMKVRAWTEHARVFADAGHEADDALRSEVEALKKQMARIRGLR